MGKEFTQALNKTLSLDGRLVEQMRAFFEQNHCRDEKEPLSQEEWTKGVATPAGQALYRSFLEKYGPQQSLNTPVIFSQENLFDYTISLSLADIVGVSTRDYLHSAGISGARMMNYHEPDTGLNAWFYLGLSTPLSPNQIATLKLQLLNSLHQQGIQFKETDFEVRMLRPEDPQADRFKFPHNYVIHFFSHPCPLKLS